MSWVYNLVSQNYLKYLIRKDKYIAHAYWKALEKVFSDNFQAQILQFC